HGQSRAAQESSVREADRRGRERGLCRWRPRAPALDRRPGGGAARALRPARGPLVDLSVRRRDREAGPAGRLRPRDGAAADGPADRRRGGGAARARQPRGAGGRAHAVGARDGGDHRRQQPDRRAGGQAADQQHHRRPRGGARSAGAGARRPRAKERAFSGRRASVSREAQPELHVRRRPMPPLAILLSVLVAAPLLLAAPVANAADDFKIALVAPLSGRWARQGQLKKMGAEMAIAEIHAQGGIKALGGAKLVLREADAGENTAAAALSVRPLRVKLHKAKGIEIFVDEIWALPLADATAIVQKIRSTHPDIVCYGATNSPDSIQVLQKVKEFGVKVPIQGV